MNEITDEAHADPLSALPMGDGRSPVDCLIIGGGPAGLSAAVYLGRLRRSVIVVDDEEGRSTWQQVNRNYLGFPDGVHATALREIGEKQATQYGVEFLDARAKQVEGAGEGGQKLFRTITTRGDVLSRTIVLATGVQDHFPEFEGSEQCIGKSMFWCIICDGYEAIGKKLIVLGHDDRAASLALQLLVFTDRVSLVAWDQPLELAAERLEALREHGVQVYDATCRSYQCGMGQLTSITLDDETTLELEMVFVAQHIQPNNQLAKALNLKLDRHGYILADSEQRTNVEGVFAAGDVTRLHNHQVSSAVHEGGMAAAAVNYYLYPDWQKD